MPILKSLSLAVLPGAIRDPVVLRRTRLIERLEEQKQLLSEPRLVRTRQKWVTVDGQRQLTSKQQKVHPWWHEDPSGRVFMSVKIGGRRIEFEKGKAAIAVPSKDQLADVIGKLITATAAGEFDTFLAQQRRPGTPSNAKRAA